MSKRRGPRTRSAPGPAMPGNVEQGKAGSAKGLTRGGPRSKGREAVFRLLVVIGLPLLILAGVEGVLRVFGYGYSTQFFVKMEGADAYTTSPKYGWRFSPREIATAPYPVILPAKKRPGTKRVFILGESAAQGTPIPAFGFGRILDAAWKTCYPDAPVEIVNVAMRGINSHGILPIAQECAEHEPDVFLIYMGNNETIGLHAPKPNGPKWVTPLWVLRSVQCVREARLGQLLLNIAHRLVSKKRPEQDMEFFRKHRLALDDPRRAGIYRNFRANLAEILEATRGSNAKVILCTVAGNLVDFPPLASLHRKMLSPEDLLKWEEFYKQGIELENGKKLADAIGRYHEAAKVDDHYAELHFRLGRCYLQTGKTNEALGAFKLARDWDALQARTDGRLNKIIQDLAEQAKRDGKPGEVILLDAEEVFAQEQLKGGQRLFHEHVHLTFDGDYLMTRTLLPALAPVLQKPASQSLPSRAECAAALGFSEWDELSTVAVTARLTGKAPFLDQLEHTRRQAQLEGWLATSTRAFQEQGGIARALEVYQKALAQRPDDWQIHMNLGVFLGQLGDQAMAARQVNEGMHYHKNAAHELDEAVKLMPQWATLRTLLAKELWKSGRRDAAVEQLHQALKVDPDCGAAKEGLKTL